MNSIIDEWHRAATVADEDAFFGFMSEDCIYLGTDMTEKWTRDELRQWSAPHFNKESAWNFKARDRELYFSPDSSIAWFDEKLDTWMGDCRGSGVMVNRDGQWLLKHYHLSVTVPNEKIKGFIDLLKIR